MSGGFPYRVLRRHLEHGEAVALATIVEAKGSVPREVGAQMIIHPLSQHVGTIGGGCGEAETIRVGLDVITTGRPEVVTVDLTEPISMEATGVCGGKYWVFVEPWRPGEEAEQLLRTWEEAVEAHRPVARVVVVRAEGQWAAVLGAQALVGPEGPLVGALPLPNWEEEVLPAALQALAQGKHTILKYRLEGGPVHVFVEVHRPPPRLVIVGAGHIAVPLAQIAHINGYRVHVVDDRPSLVTRDRFPTAAGLHVGPLPEVLREVDVDEDTCVVLVTRGHQLDVACLLELLDKPWAYLGMIGSRRRVRAVFELLQREKGVSADALRRVHAPIGLDIGAETPAEIATAIMAEIILTRRGGTGRPLCLVKGAFRKDPSPSLLPTP